MAKHARGGGAEINSKKTQKQAARVGFVLPEVGGLQTNDSIIEVDNRLNF